MMAATRSKSVKKAISKYYTQLRDTQSAIGGSDLIAMGLQPGPRFRQILETVLDAKLNEQLETREDEIQFVRRLLDNKTLDSRE
jgi:tRNA nucleotidyltransferase (CCA-adding enzyme)